MSSTGLIMVLKRMRADTLIVAAAAVTIILAIILLAAGPIYADAVTVAGAQRTLNDAAIPEANIAISQRATGEDFPVSDELVTREVNRLLASTGGVIIRLGESEPYRLPDDILQQVESSDPDDDRPRQTKLAYYDDIASHAALVDGRWPAPSSDVVEVVLPEQARQILGIQIGDEFVVTNRLAASFTVGVQVVGIYQATDASEPYWYGDLLPVDGTEFGESVVVIGPLVTDRETFINTVMVRLTNVEWRVLPDYDRLAIRDIPPLRGNVNRFPDRLEQQQQVGTPYQVDSGLNALLAEIERGLLAARSGVFILTLQLAILAGYALILTANLLAESRSVEMALMRSRGAGIRQIAGFSLLEGLLLIVPAVVLGPWLAALSLQLLNVAGPLATIDLSLTPEVTRLSYIFAALAGFGCLLVLIIPTMLAARSVLSARAARGRETEAPIWQRAGVDLALVAIAVLGFVQLRRYGSPLTETVRGRLEIDPLLIAAPALGLVAGAILALRLIPLVGRIAERFSSRGNRLVAALASWQFSRRSSRYARSALLLMLALGIGLFAVAFSQTWNDSQADQADFQIGADIVVRPDRTSRSVSPAYLGAAYEDLDGVRSAMPVSSGAINIPLASGSGRTIQIDATRASNIVEVRDDFATDELEELMIPLAQGRPDINGTPIPGEPQQLAFDVRLQISRICTEPELVTDEVGAPGVHVYETYTCQEHQSLSPYQLRAFDVPVTPLIVIQDGRGQLYRIAGAALESDENVQRVTFDLAAQFDEKSVTPQYPVQLIEIELMSARGPTGLTREGTFTLVSVLASDSVSSEEWVPVEVISDTREWEIEAPPPSGNLTSTTAPDLILSGSDPDSILSLSFTVGTAGTSFGFFGSERSYYPVPVEVSLRLRQTAPPERIPIIVNTRLLELVAFNDEARFRLLLGGDERPVEIVGAVDAFPSIDPDEDVIVIVDKPTLDTLQYLETGRVETTAESWWLSVDNGDTGAIAATLETAPFNSNQIETIADRTRELRTDPVALGTIGALTLGFTAAVIFAIVGFVSSAVVGARERMAEFALLRAVGLSARQLAGWLLMENGFLVVLSLIGGTALGFLLSWLILPLITVNREAEQVFPSLIVVIPWQTILLLEAVILLLLLIVSTALALILRRVGLGAALRIGED